jgi:hypothetical protein
LGCVPICFSKLGFIKLRDGGLLHGQDGLHFKFRDLTAATVAAALGFRVLLG